MLCIEVVHYTQSLAEIASDCDLFRKKVAAKEIFGSNLRLGRKVLSVALGDSQNGVARSGDTAWAALCAAHESVGQRPHSSILVRRVGFEPT